MRSNRPSPNSNIHILSGNLKLSNTMGWKFAEYSRGGKWPTLFYEGWKVADILFLRDGNWPTLFFSTMESCRHVVD